MAMSSFKQQCPSCEAWVPIRDANLIGRKIDCPKCKYRFVVEEPSAAADEQEEAAEPASKRSKGKPTEAVTAKLPAGGKAAGKPGSKRSRSDADDAEATPKKGRRKAAGMSPKLVVGLVLGLVGIVLLGVVGFFMFNSSESGSTTGGGGGGAAPAAGATAPVADAAAPAEGAGEAPKDAKSPAVLSRDSDLATNLLPNDSDVIININFREVLGSPVGRAAFESAGAFRRDVLDQTLGFHLADLDRVLLTGNAAKSSSFWVLHSTRPFPVDGVKNAFGVKPGPESPIQGQEYFQFDASKVSKTIMQMVQSAIPALKVPPQGAQTTMWAVRFPDAQTLVLSDPVSMKSFLKVNGRPEVKTAPPSAEPASKPPEGRDGGGEGRGPGGRGGPPSMMAAGAGPGGAGGAEGAMAAGKGGPGGASPGAVGGSGSDSDGSGIAPSRAYLTIDPAMKMMLDRLESKGTVLLSAALNMPSILASPPAKAAMLLAPAAGVKQANDLNIFGMALALQDGATFSLGLEAKTLDAGRTFNKHLQDGAADLAKGLSEFLDTKFEVVTDQPDPNQGLAGPGGMGPGGMGPGGMGPGGMAGRMSRGGEMAGPGGMGPGGVGGGAGRFGRAGGAGAPAMEGGPGAGIGMPRGPGGFGALGGPLGEEKPPTSTVQVELQDKVVVLTVHYLMDQKAYDKMMALISPQMRQLKGRVDMVGGQNRLHDLAAALRALSESRQQFPRGTLERRIESTRAGRPYPPDLRISWMAELLPYLGQEEMYRRINRDRAWRDPENLGFATTLVPQFVDAQYPQDSWWVQYPGLREKVGATHFVGLAGIGLDAAEYSANDPAALPKLGMFGYDRETRLVDVADGLSNTIALAQVPPTFKRPWMASGGSTVQGVPETRSVQPFVSTQYNGKKGTYVIMADGSVRFVAENISDEVFKSMVTIKGGETLFLNREAPIVPRPDQQQAELRTQPTAPALALPPAAVAPPPPLEKKTEPEPTQLPVKQP
jgi:flagellar basal body-associated protein FliL